MDIAILHRKFVTELTLTLDSISDNVIANHIIFIS